MQVVLLGPPHALWHGEPCDLPRRQVRGLLFYLAQAAEPTPRDRLAFLFWPDLPDGDARAHLKRLLSTLRAALPDGSLLHAGSGCVELDPSRLWCDVTAFQRLAAASDPGAWAQATALYRGPFLDGFSLPDSLEYCDWQAQTEAQLLRRYLAALSGLVDARRATGELDAASAYAQQALAVDDLAEDMHRRLIELHAARGDRSAAARQFERCALVLERELGVSPLPETRTAFEAAMAARPTPQPAPPRWAILPSLDLPLIGREEALHGLAAAYRRLHGGGLILIAGEPGIGKSRLMQTFAGASAATVLAGGAAPLTARQPALRAGHLSPGRHVGRGGGEARPLPGPACWPRPCYPS